MGETAPPAREKKILPPRWLPRFPEREADREGGSPAPSARAISRVPLDAHLRQMGTERAGCVPSAPSRAGGGRDGWSPRCGSRYRRRGAGAPIDGTAASCHDHRMGGGRWRAERRLLTTLVQGAGGKTQPDLLKRQEAGRREVGQTAMEAAVGGPELPVGSQRSPCRVVSLQGGGG